MLDGQTPVAAVVMFAIIVKKSSATLGVENPSLGQTQTKVDHELKKRESLKNRS
jgi:hypothetical protein